MLRLLTDSHVPPKVAEAVRRMVPAEIIPLREWHGGNYLHQEDQVLLEIAWQEKLTIVTYDVNTFPLHVKARLERGGCTRGSDLWNPAASAKPGRSDRPQRGRNLAKTWRGRLDEPDWFHRLKGLSGDFGCWKVWGVKSMVAV